MVRRSGALRASIAALVPLALVLSAVACQSSNSVKPTPTAAKPELLLLSGPRGSIVTVGTDGTHKTVLPQTGRTPSWTPDGRIVFVSSRSQIWLMDADGSDAHQVGELDLEQGNPIVKPQMADNGTIVFSDIQGKPSKTADNPGPQNGAWVINEDGTGLRMVVRQCTMASIAPDGSWLSCTKETSRQREIWRVQLDGSELRQLTFTDRDTTSEYPDGNASSISPDGRTIAFFSGKESDLGTGGFTQSVFTWGHRNVAVIPAEGGPRRTVTACTPATTPSEVKAIAANGCLAADNPAWSRDGRRLVYDRGTPNPSTGGTWAIDLDGTNAHQLAREARGGGNVPLR
jgi:Tol biopolymer transport system component